MFKPFNLEVVLLCMLNFQRKLNNFNGDALAETSLFFPLFRNG